MPEGKATYVSGMFGRIARRYDAMNWLMTLGRDRGWRRASVAALDCRPGSLVLDAGTGTLDFLPLLAKQDCRSVGVDFSLPMMIAGRHKVERLRGGRAWQAMPLPADTGPATDAAAGRPEPAPVGARAWQAMPLLAAADAQQLPFADASFDGVVTGFMLRNVDNLTAALREMTRVLRPGGRFVCLELTWPRSPVFRRLFSLYFGRVVPLLGGLISGQRDAYDYLPRSVATFAPPAALASLMSVVGLHDVHYRLLAMGSVALHVGQK
ncbi:MAG: class I SAM-dependent methyltransferase [Anaerolineae bacterium]